MPNIKSAKKRVKVIATKTEQNKMIKSNLKTTVKKAYEAIENNDTILFSAELLEMLLTENQVINNYQYTDSIHEVVSNAICVDYEL